MTSRPDPRRSWLDYAIYPTLVGTATIVFVVAVGSGVAYWQVAPWVLLAGAVAVVALERVRPWAAAWRQDHGDTRTDVAHLVGNLATSHVSLALYAALLGESPRGIWPHALPFVAQLAIAVLVMDLGLYVVHRASHRFRWLWRLHATHHSAPRLYWLNGQRRHLLHEVLEGAPGILVLGIAGAPASVVGCYLGVLAVHLMLQHGNIWHHAGALRFVFAVAELHRWHHQRLYAQTQGNYGALLCIWDRLLGTTLPDRGDAPVDVGMDDEPDLPTHWAGQLVWPFRRSKACRVAAAVFVGALLLLPPSGCATTLRPTGPEGELELRVGPVDLAPSPAGEEHSHADMVEARARYRTAEAGWITRSSPRWRMRTAKPRPASCCTTSPVGAPGRSLVRTAARCDRARSCAAHRPAVRRGRRRDRL